MMVGVPARQKGWMSRHGHVLKPNAQGDLICPESGFRYKLADGVMRCLDLDEEAPLPANLAQGKKTYDEFKGA
jgi:UDP-2-acetamido-3-amino-2,3-dideoxy-glucuronate N-acetyltransferase